MQELELLDLFCYDANDNLINDSGYVGLNSSSNYNALVALGVDDINLSSPYNGLVNNGLGFLTQVKQTTGSYFLYVYSPIASTTWSFQTYATTLSSIAMGATPYTTTALACAGSTSTTVYYNGQNSIPSEGNIIYSDAAGTTLFAGDSKYYYISGYALNIDNFGVVLSVTPCGCTEVAVPVVIQGNVEFIQGNDVSIKIAATNNPTSYAVSTTSSNYAIDGGTVGGVVTGQNPSTLLYENVVVNVGQVIYKCYVTGTISVVTGSDVTFSLVGPCQTNSMPAGLELDTATGLISGTASGFGQYNLTVTATNCVGVSIPNTFTITVNSQPVNYIPIQVDKVNNQVSAAACCAISVPTFVTMYSSGYTVFPMVDDIVYEDQNGATPLVGGSNWYLVK